MRAGPGTVKAPVGNDPETGGDTTPAGLASVADRVSHHGPGDRYAPVTPPEEA